MLPLYDAGRPVLRKQVNILPTKNRPRVELKHVSYDEALIGGIFVCSDITLGGHINELPQRRGFPPISLLPFTNTKKWIDSCQAKKPEVALEPFNLTARNYVKNQQQWNLQEIMRLPLKDCELLEYEIGYELLNTKALHFLHSCHELKASRDSYKRKTACFSSPSQSVASLVDAQYQYDNAHRETYRDTELLSEHLQFSPINITTSSSSVGDNVIYTGYRIFEKPLQWGSQPSAWPSIVNDMPFKPKKLRALISRTSSYATNESSRYSDGELGFAYNDVIWEKYLSELLEKVRVKWIILQTNNNIDNGDKMENIDAALIQHKHNCDWPVGPPRHQVSHQHQSVVLPQHLLLIPTCTSNTPHELIPLPSGYLSMHSMKQLSPTSEMKLGNNQLSSSIGNTQWESFRGAYIPLPCTPEMPHSHVDKHNLPSVLFPPHKLTPFPPLELPALFTDQVEDDITTPPWLQSVLLPSKRANASITPMSYQPTAQVLPGLLQRTESLVTEEVEPCMMTEEILMWTEEESISGATVPATTDHMDSTTSSPNLLSTNIEVTTKESTFIQGQNTSVSSESSSFNNRPSEGIEGDLGSLNFLLDTVGLPSLSKYQQLRQKQLEDNQDLRAKSLPDAQLAAPAPASCPMPKQRAAMHHIHQQNQLLLPPQQETSGKSIGEIPLEIFISEGLMEASSWLVADLAEQHSIHCRDYPLEDPLAMIIDGHTGVVLLTSEISQSREFLKNLVKAMTLIAYKFRVLWILNLQGIGSDSSGFMPGLYQSLSQFPCRTILRHTTNGRLAEMIASICKDCTAEAQLNHVDRTAYLHRPIFAALEKGATLDFTNPHSTNSNTSALPILQQHCEFLQLFPTCNFYIAAELLLKWPLSTLASLSTSDVLDGSRLQLRYDPALSDMMTLLQRHIGIRIPYEPHQLQQQLPMHHASDATLPLSQRTDESRHPQKHLQQAPVLSSAGYQVRNFPQL